MAKSRAVLNPNLGLYLGKAKLGLLPEMLQDGLNFRIKHGKLNNLSLGWTRFEEFTLNGPVVLINNFLLRTGTELLVFGTTTDLYSYNSGSGAVSFITPRYETGTASANGTAVIGIGTLWLTNAKAGDEIHFGAANYTDPTGTWYEIDSVGGDTAITLTASAGVIGNGAYTLRKKFTGDILDIWSTDVFYNASPSNEDEWWATNGVDDVVRWNGTDTQVEVMSSLNFKCKALGVYKNMMIFGFIVQGGANKPADIINSNVGEPQNVTTGISEQFKVHGYSGEIYALKPIGDALVVYSQNNITLAQYIGGDLIFAFRHVISDQGALGPRAVADFGDYHQYVSRDGLYIFDGASTKEVGEHIFREVLRTQKSANRTFTFHHFNDENAELTWVVPLTSDTTDAPTIGWTEHYLEDTGRLQKLAFSKREFPFTSAGYYTRSSGLTWDQLTDAWQDLTFRWDDQFFSAAFPISLVGDYSGKVYTLNTSQSKDGTAIESYIRFGRRPLFDGRVRGLVSRVYPFVGPETTQLEVTVRLTDTPEGTIDITQTDEMDNTVSGARFTSPFRRGRFVELQFGSTGKPWELTGYDVDIRPGGRR